MNETLRALFPLAEQVVYLNHAAVSPPPVPTIEAVTAQGGTLVQPIGADAPEITARFRDPGGNVIGLYQEPGR